jgi:hypothetical protein
MPVDIAKTYLEVQRLREAVQKAELALRIFLGRSPPRARNSARMDVRGLQPINSRIAGLKRSRN